MPYFDYAILGQKVYLSTLLDLYNGEVVSYNYDTRPNYALVDDMLQKALPLVPERTSLIIHSDQGWQYQLKAYQHTLKERGIQQSMSRKGNCLDNAVMENFFGLLKSEFFYLEKFDTLGQFMQELNRYIEYYNTVRIKAKLNGLSPVQYRTQATLVA